MEESLPSKQQEPKTNSAPKITLAERFQYGLQCCICIIYFACSISLLAFITQNNMAYVQQTYRQEFAANVVANPLFSSANVVSRAPLAILERYAPLYNPDGSRTYRQMVSSIIMLPTQIHNPESNAAFLTVLPIPKSIRIMDEPIPLRQKVAGAYYWDEPNGTITQNEGGLLQTAEGRKLILDTMQQFISAGYRKDLVRPGTQLPNLGRCMRVASGGEFDEDELQRLQNNTHRLGACLLTGQHATVDMTSNYDTSMVPFSSVNTVFMVTLIMWISTSFALFHIGGSIKTWSEMHDDPYDPDRLKEQATLGCTSDDWFMIGSMLWNVIPACLLAWQGGRYLLSIPLNNALMAIVALLVCTLLQWKWANFYAFDTATQDMLARCVLLHEDLQPEVQQAGGALASEAGGGGGGGVGGAAPLPPCNVQQCVFDTSNFLSTASAVRDYGVQQYAKMVSSTSSAANAGLRMRRSHSRSGGGGQGSLMLPSSASPMQRSFFANPYGRKQERMALLHTTSAMPSYSTLVRMGSPMAQYNYITMIRKEMMIDAAKGIEYALTTPLLFGTLLAAAAPAVPTGMVQWACGCLMASHLLVAPLLYISHFSRTHAADGVSRMPLASSILVLLLACAILQFVGLRICFTHFYNTFNMYGDQHAWFPLAGGMIFLQVTYVVSVFADVLINTFVAGCCSPSWEPVISTWYTLLNFFLKVAIAYTFAVHAEKEEFPVLTFNVWDILHNETM